MMGELEADISKLLAGEVTPVRHVDVIYTSAKQPANQFVPICKRTVAYIVMAVLFDDRDRVALIQEAKPSCHGKWYLPAGRVEPGENLIDGVKREALEESGLLFEPESLVYMEMQRSTWVRFTYIGRAVGGKLKTLADQDSESLQANWFTLEQIRNDFVPLRYKDILPALEVAERYHFSSVDKRHPATSVVIQPHIYLVHRMLIFHQFQDRTVDVLCYKNDGYHIPCCHMYPGGLSVHNSVYYLATDVFGIECKITSKILILLGVVSVEHCGMPAREHDGMCVTTAARLEPHNDRDETITPHNKDYEWISIRGESLLTEIHRRIFQENLLIPINFFH